MTRLIICCCSCENDVLTVFTVTDLNLLSPVSRKVPGHLSKKKGDLPSESVGVAEIGRSGRHTDDGYRVGCAH